MRHSAEAWSGKTSEVPGFPLSLYTESASQFGRPFWDALSALEDMRLQGNRPACVYACCQVSTSSLAAA